MKSDVTLFCEADRYDTMGFHGTCLMSDVLVGTVLKSGYVRLPTRRHGGWACLTSEVSVVV